MTISYTTAVRNARLDNLTTQIGSAALIRIYDATGGVPASANAAISTQVLSEQVAGSPFAPAAAAGGNA